MICPNCGFNQADGKKFCENCGSSLGVQAAQGMSLTEGEKQLVNAYFEELSQRSTEGSDPDGES